MSSSVGSGTPSTRGRGTTSSSWKNPSRTSASSHSAPTSATRASSHCRPPTARCHSGTRSGPSSVAATARSSRSARRSSETSTVRRSSSRQACGEPVARRVARLADRRLHPGQLDRAGRGQGGAGPLVAQVQPGERIGPELPGPAQQRPAGHRGAGPDGRALDRGGHRRHAGRRGQRADQALALPAADLAGPGVVLRAVPLRAPAAAPRTSAVSRSVAARRAATRCASSPRSSATPAPVRAETASSGVAVQSLAVEQRAQVGQARRCGRGIEPVDLVQHDEQHAGVTGERHQVAVVHRGVGVLLRVEHPHQDVDQRRPADRPRAGAPAARCRGRAGRAAPARPVPARAGAGAGAGPRASRAAGRSRRPRPRPPSPTRWRGRRRWSAAAPRACSPPRRSAR